MRGILLALLGAWGGFVHASCGDDLAARPAAIVRYELSPAARAALHDYGLNEKEFASALNTRPAFPLVEDGRFWSVVFEPNPRLADRGFRIAGRIGADGFARIEELFRSDYEDEAEYFKCVGRLRGLAPAKLRLSRRVLNCREVMVRASVQVKLWLKHRLSLGQVARLLNEAEAPEFDEAHRARHPRYTLRAALGDGRWLQAVLEDHSLCPTALVTAFEVR